MRARPSTYRAYIGLDELLVAARPLSPPGAAEWAAERFFIVAHQTSELWASQVLVELRMARSSAEAREWPAVRATLARIEAVLDLICATLRQLEHLEAGAFDRFRAAVDGISAAESEQFNELLRAGAQCDIAAISDALAAAGNDGDVTAARDHLEVGLQLIAAWRHAHLSLARQFVGGRAGTGGTSGVTYLEERLAASASPARAEVVS